MACVDKKLNSAEQEQAVDLMMNGVKRVALFLEKKGVCAVCSLDFQLRNVLAFHKELGRVEAEAALACIMSAYNKAYEGEASLVEEPIDYEGH
jgi:hypothetical protein